MEKYYTSQFYEVIFVVRRGYGLIGKCAIVNYVQYFNTNYQINNKTLIHVHSDILRE